VVAQSRLNEDASVMRLSHACGALAVAVLLTAMAAHPSMAQGVPTTSRGFQPPNKRTTLPDFAPQAQPAALPGTLNLAAPADRTEVDLAPTEALFDAINRGDLAAARDAINRGADLGGKNILGMTPVELSVDLGRNDITFLLLSNRTATGPSSVAPIAKPPAKAAAAVAHVPAATVVTTKPVPTSEQFAKQDGGTPNPQSGFLGFGSSVQ
jgi:hypothetical protein